VLQPIFQGWRITSNYEPQKLDSNRGSLNIKGLPRTDFAKWRMRS